jgi:SNF2 family DNA or RNA helicase
MAAPSSEETEFAKMAKAFMDGLAEGGIGLDKALKLFGLERNINPENRVYRLPGLKSGVDIFDYQVAGAGWVVQTLESVYRGCVLADKMGLGKTHQSICVIGYIQQYWRDRKSRRSTTNDPKYLNKLTLITCPQSCIGGWKKHVIELLPEDNVLKIYTSSTCKSWSVTSDWLNRRDSKTILLTTPTLLNARNGRKQAPYAGLKIAPRT